MDPFCGPRAPRPPEPPRPTGSASQAGAATQLPRSLTTTTHTSSDRTRLAEEPQWRRGRLRDAVAARYIALEIEEVREDSLNAHDLRLPEVLTDIDLARRFIDSMRAGDVWVTLRTAKHRNSYSQWLPNDIFDIDALSVAAAYCDIVVTERHSAHVLRAGGIPENLGTTVLTSVDELAHYATRFG